jgi:hypothetical protein
MNSHHKQIRELLAGSDGLTVKQIQIALQIEVRTLNKSINSMGDAYIDRWTGPYRGQWAAVWCVAEVPQHCPKPDEKNMAAPQAQTHRDSGARSDDLGNGQSQRTADYVGVDQRQSLGGQALGFIRNTLWRKRRAADTPLDAVDKKQ